MEMQQSIDPELVANQRAEMKQNIQELEDREDQLERDKFEAEHDGLSMRGEDPETIHPQAETLNVLDGVDQPKEDDQLELGEANKVEAA